MKVPRESTANVILQVDDTQHVIVEKQHDNRFDPGLIDGLQSGNFELDEGEYIIIITSLNNTE